MEKLVKGTRVIWKPIKARANCYGHSIATAPIECEVIRGPDRNGNYRVKLLCKKSQLWLSKPEYSVHDKALLRGEL